MTVREKCYVWWGKKNHRAHNEGGTQFKTKLSLRKCNISVTLSSEDVVSSVIEHCRMQNYTTDTLMHEVHLAASSVVCAFNVVRLRRSYAHLLPPCLSKKA